MANYINLKKIRDLSKRSTTNSKVELMQEKDTDELFVRKLIYGIEQPLYQAIFEREIRALYKLNRCENIVKIHTHKHMKVKNTNEKVGCIFLEYILGNELSNVDITGLSSKDKFSIIRQLLNAIEVAHSNGIIHRDINPNNIMFTDENEIKVIDFGICKIKEMISSSTVYHMGTNLYSAPEVHQQSENATEKSDLYSIGAVIYYLFTGETPPLSINFQKRLDEMSGIDIELKPVIKKLVAENPLDRYNDVFELKVDLANLFARFLNINQQINVVINYDKFKKLQNQHLIPRNARISDSQYITQNFVEILAYKNDNNIYFFVGSNYLFECDYDKDINVFRVIDVKKIVPIEKDRYRKKYAEIHAKVQTIDLRQVHRQSKNDSFEIKNIIDEFYNESKSKKNVDSEYRVKYGVWRELLNLTKESIDDSIVRLQYESYTSKGNLLEFVLNRGVFLDNGPLEKEIGFIYEKKSRARNKVKPIFIGYYEDDYFKNNRVMLKIKYLKDKPNLPQKGTICLDYRQDLSNVQRQLDALDTLEKEDYSCPFNLKSILSGVDYPKMKSIEDNFEFFNKKLDISQQAAVKKSLNSDSVCIIQGPPGTGKTNVVIEIIRQILKNNEENKELPEKRILLVSQSHPAVDKMLDDLVEQTDFRPNLIRIGRDEKLNPVIKQGHSLLNVKNRWIDITRGKCRENSLSLCEELKLNHEEFEQYYIENEKKKIDGYKITEESKDIIEKFVEKTRTPKKRQMREILEIQKQWIEQLPQCDEVDLYIIKSTTIIAGTCTGFISNKVIRYADFDYLIIDEAAKATYPELAVSLNKASNIIMVGDHKQLPPVLDDDIINNNRGRLPYKSLSSGVFENLYEMFPENNKHRLTIQYRMNPVIGTLISQVFYDNDIQNGIEYEKRQIDIDGYRNIAIEWLSTSSSAKKLRNERAVGKAPRITYKNDLEIRIIKEKLEFIDKNVKKKTKVGVITAYSAQKYALSDMIKQQVYKNLIIEIDTVDAFQGSQKEIIIYSTVRSNDRPGKIGFLKSEARLNVAFSRAQSLLIIVGDQEFLNNRADIQNRFPEIIEYINNNKNCRSVSV